MLIHSLRKRTLSVYLAGQRWQLPLILPIGLSVQDPDTPQREMAQCRVFHLAQAAFRHHNWVQHQARTMGEQKPVLAIWEEYLVYASNGWIQDTRDLEIVGFLSKVRGR